MGGENGGKRGTPLTKNFKKWAKTTASAVNFPFYQCYID